MANNNPHPEHYFASNLKYLLKKFGINQSELAQYMNRQQTSVSNWINGISVPDVDDLVKVYHYFGFGIDALVLMDLSKSQLVTDKYVAEFERQRKPGEETAEKNILREPDPVLNKAVMGQLKLMDDKLDSLHGLTRKLVEKEKKPVSKRKG